MKRILIIDDETNFTRSLTEYLTRDDTEVLSAATGKIGLRIGAEKRIDIVLLDQRLPDGDGADLCASLLELNPRVKIIFSTAYPSFDNVVTALRNGAYDYLSKPIELEALDLAVERAMKLTRLEGIEEMSRYQAVKQREASMIIGNSAAFDEVRKLAELASRSQAPVLITGETGTGKNVIAQYIHYRSGVDGRPFVAVNAAAIPRELMESELFGHEKGSFTSANQTRKGMFELADGGTLFLDEIGNLIPELQAKLLSVLEEKRVRRVGAERALDVNVRIITATNAELPKEIAAGRFREDLYYRLNVIHIHLPPLRERFHDVEQLCHHLVKQLAGGREATVPAAEIDALKKYPWPGNVRELKNIIERTLTLQEGPVIYPSRFLKESNEMSRVSDISKSAARAPVDDKEVVLLTMAEVEKRHILNVLEQCEGNLAKTSRILNISESTLRRRMKDSSD